MFSRQQFIHRWLWAVVFCAALWVTGCAKDRYDPGELLPVAGTVLVEGKPLTSGDVLFYPDADQGNPSKHIPTGTVDREGRYELSTIGKKGAPPGWYRVVVTSSQGVFPPPGQKNKNPKWLVPMKYGDPETTDLIVHVVAEPKPDAYVLEITK